MNELNDLVAALSRGGQDSTDVLDKLRGLLGLPNSGRSPIPKPLRDLRNPTTAKGRLNRPHFEWSAEDDGETFIAPFPRLYWDRNGVEVRVESEEDLVSRDCTGWTERPPMRNAMTAAERAAAELAMLSPEDRAFVLEAQKQVRLNRVKDILSGLSQADIAAVIGSQPASVTPLEPKKDTKKEPEKKSA